MRFFGPIFDRSLARKLENKFGAFDSPTMGDLGASSVEYYGRKGRIISADEQDLWRYVGIAVVSSDVYSDADAYQMKRTRNVGGPFKKFAALGPYAWKTATDYGAPATNSGGSCLAVAVGVGEVIFWTTAVAGATTVYRWHLFNASPKFRDPIAKGKAVPVVNISQSEHIFQDDPGLPFYVFTGWLLSGETYERGAAFFYRQFNGDSPDIERVKCVHTDTSFSGWVTTELPTPAGQHAMIPRIVCSKARHMAGVVASWDAILDEWILQLCTSADNGNSWIMTTITEAVQINDWWYQEHTCAAASGSYDVFAKPNGDVIRHQAGAMTAYTYLSGVLPEAKIRAIYHLGGGVFVCFSGIDMTTSISLVVHRSTDHGATWAAVAGTGVAGKPPEHIGIPLIVAAYESAGVPGRAVIPAFNATSNSYEWLESTDGGQTWPRLSGLPSALPPATDYDNPSFGYEFHQFVDVGPSEKNKADGSIDVTVGTDPSRWASLIEV